MSDGHDIFQLYAQTAGVFFHDEPISCCFNDFARHSNAYYYKGSLNIL